MPDRRYKTANWQRLRKAVLARDGYVCRVQGGRCAGFASTVHHVIPSSERPDLFWDPANLLSSCGPCNYSGGAAIAASNGRRRVEYLHQVIEAQEQRIQELAERLARYENPATGDRLNPPRPAIY